MEHLMTPKQQVERMNLQLRLLERKQLMPSYLCLNQVDRNGMWGLVEVFKHLSASSCRNRILRYVSDFKCFLYILCCVAVI